MDPEILSALLKIILIDLVLSGDNAVVIGMAAQRLPPEQRRKAILFGGGGAVVLRVIFTIIAALLLKIPLLLAIGGALLIWIAIRLVLPAAAPHGSVAPAGSLGQAIRTIVMADIVMSLDNMVAVAGAAHGHLWLLLFGLCLSIPILLLGSSFVARLIDRFPWINYVGAAILVHTSLEMIFEDEVLHRYLGFSIAVEWLIIILGVAFVVALGVLTGRRRDRAALRLQRDVHVADSGS
ncbi:MAG TPA: TerC family protein [Thermomicrobiales bacterium]|nr:TerC family protein [Thermomicrobiales bacterium]